MSLPRRLLHTSTVLYGRLRGRSYVEDFVRIYPDGFQYYPLGLRRRWPEAVRRNYANHRKFYEFCAQFVSGRTVCDVGCGAGYGFGVLALAAPRMQLGCDLSPHAVAFARDHYGALAVVSRQDATALDYPDGVADVTICSEVLEHVKDYGMEQQLLANLNRVTRPGGLIILGTPNIEVSPGHGFAYPELSALIAANYEASVLFENLAWTDAESAAAYRRRVETGQVGLLSGRAVDLADAVQPISDAGQPYDVTGKTDGRRAPPQLELAGYVVDTTPLHNTHSFVAVCVNP